MTDRSSPAPALEVAGPNADMIAYWNGVAAERWLDGQELLDAQIAPIGTVAIERAAPSKGERVLDVGCGCGQTTLQLAERVGPDGSIVGLDISAPMLARAAERAAAAGLSNVSFENEDAQRHAFGPGRFDLLFSRFGVMFFADPTAAFGNLRSALVPGGRLTFLCWQEIGKNPWMLVPVQAASAHVTMSPPSPGSPGPYAFADPERVRAILEGAGFEDVALDGVESDVVLGGAGGLDVAVPFLLGVGPLSAALRDAPEKREPVAAAVRGALAAYLTDDGVRMGSSVWIVTARNPA